MRRVRRPALALLCASSLPGLAAAQGHARVCIEWEGAPAPAALAGSPWPRAAALDLTAGRSCFYDVPAGPQLLTVTGGGAARELSLHVQPGEAIDVREVDGALEVAARGRASMGTGFGPRRLRELPGSVEPWSLLETVETAVIADRIDGGGLWAGRPGRTSTHGSSWTQASFTAGALDLTDPLRAGTPLAWPALAGLGAFDAATAALPAELGTPGTHVRLERRPPPERWSLWAEGSATLGQGRAAGPAPSTPTSGPEPPVARFGHGRRLALAAGGPLGGTLRGRLAGLVDDARRFEGGRAPALDSDVRALDAGVSWTPGGAQEVRARVDVASLRGPYAGRALFADEGLAERDRLLGLEGEWRARARSGRMAWLAAAYHSARLDADAGRQPGTFERLLDGPAAALPLPGRTSRARAQAAAGVQLAPRAAGVSWHALRVGIQAARTGASVDWPGAPVTAAETLGGRPARIWTFRAGGRSQWNGADLALHASDSIALGRTLHLEAGLRLETSRLSARGAAEAIGWTALSPRLFARWQPAGPLTLLAGWGRYRHRLPLSLAAWGDAQAPTADVFLWNDAGDGVFAGGERGVLVARGGPGAPLGRLDPGLRAPRTDEVVAGMEGRFGRVRVAFTGVHRDERGLVESVNVGVPAAAYTLTTVPDPAGDLVGPQDDQLLPLYLRDPLTFGADAFLLTNPAGHDTRHQGVALTVELATEKVQLLLGATAHRSDGAGAFRGFRPGENDQGLVGDLFDDPNAGTHARGRLFSDRAYTIKLSGSWRAPLGFTLGAAARYQDGQPFSRLVLAALPQGLTAVHAIPNGRARFTFIATLDARLEKEFALGSGRRAAAVVEGFNLTQRGNEVEEIVVSGGSYRAVRYREPPRVLRLGLRLSL